MNLLTPTRAHRPTTAASRHPRRYGGPDALVSRLHDLGCVVHHKLSNTVQYAICSTQFMEQVITRGDRKDEAANGDWIEKVRES